ncbi:hypothetical protein OG21DRAFT_1429077 [Imleria badia]|nr:hypothetical protein OG21DRAFT_1429077 [Imleria badia]
MDLGKLATVIVANPSLHTIPLDRLLLFLASIAPLKEDILLMQASDHTIGSPPVILPTSIQSFFSQACGIPINVIQQLWSTFKDVAWHDLAVSSLLSTPLSTFHTHGLPHAGRTLYPPDQFCSTTLCPRTLQGMWMMHAEQRQCILYTVSDGPLPVYSIHLYCPVCDVNYHHNFKVYKGEHTYYGGVPDIIQVGEHQFVECQVIKMWLIFVTNATGLYYFSPIFPHFS